jgi:isopenicillin-N epimerase
LDTGREVEFGHKLLKDHFSLRKDKVNLNHGSFGAVPKVVMTTHIDNLTEQESFPEMWFREGIYKVISRSRQAIADLVNANVEEIVLVENASYAVNSILRSYPFKKGDKVLVFSSAYRMVTDCLRFLVNSTDIEILELPIPYPLTSASILVEMVAKAIEIHGDVIKVAVFSHISSMPTMVEPVEELSRICKTMQPNMTVLIDGAHAPGEIDINLKRDFLAHADYYTGNCHKWLFCPKGSAFMWTNPRKITDMHPQPVVISSTGWYDYLGRFSYTGTRDYTAFATIPAGLSFIEDYLGGLESMRAYCRNLLRVGSQICINRWSTGYLVAWEMNASTFMTNVILPPSVDTEELAKELQDRLYNDYGLSIVYRSVPSAEIPGKEIFYVRVSSQVYLEASDFERLAAAVEEIAMDFKSRNA